MALFRDIKQFIPGGNYAVNIGWGYLSTWLEDQIKYCPVDLDPDFQRGHVWDSTKRREYIEYVLRGGQSSKDIWWNCAGWNGDTKDPLQLVDGKQRITAVLMFMDDKVEVFGGHKRSDYTDSLRLSGPDFIVHVNNLQTRAEVLQWYLELNSGGVVHTEEELAKVRKMLEDG